MEVGRTMAFKETSYLKLPYNEGGDKGFREHYVEAMDKVDKVFGYPESIKYPATMQSTFDASFFAPNTSRFELRPEMSRYVQLGNMVFFEIALNSKITFKVDSKGDIATQILGTISPAFRRVRGFYCTAMNGIAASYSLYNNSSDQTEIRLGAFGGMSISKTIPKGTYFGVAGHYMLTS